MSFFTKLKSFFKPRKKSNLKKIDVKQRFELIGRTGQGSMSKVWRARDKSLGRMVCVKLLDKEKTDDKATGEAPKKPDDKASGEAPKKTDDKASLEAAKAIPGEMFSFIQTAVKDKKTKDTDIVGFKLGKEYRDLPEEGGVLVGFEVGLGKFAASNTVDSLRPIYLTKDGEKRGAWQGKVPDKPIEVKAKPGYVVGGLTVRAGLVVDAFSVTFMKLDKNQLDVKDTYTSDWIGGEGGSKATVGGKGQIFVGVTGHVNDAKSVCSVGLIAVLKPKE